MDPIFLLIPAALLVGTSKGGLASAGSLAVPLTALLMNPVEAAALLLPVFIVTDWVSVYLYRRDFSARNLKILIPSALLGVVIAAFIVTWTSEAFLLIATGLIGFWYCLRSWLTRPDPSPRPARLLPGIIWGMLAGITSFITHTGGPPAQAYLLPQNMPKLVFAGTMSITFAAINLSKLPGYYVTGLFEGLNWSIVAILIVTGVFGTVLGRRLTMILPQAAYVRVIQVLLFGLSVVLVTKGGADLIG